MAKPKQFEVVVRPPKGERQTFTPSGTTGEPTPAERPLLRRYLLLAVDEADARDIVQAKERELAAALHPDDGADPESSAQARAAARASTYVVESVTAADPAKPKD